MTLQRDAELLEKAAIRETLVRYAAGIDRRDWELMLSCFTDDVWSSLRAMISARDATRSSRNQSAAAGFSKRSSVPPRNCTSA